MAEHEEISGRLARGRRWGLALALAALLVVGGCGGGGSNSKAKASSTSASDKSDSDSDADATDSDASDSDSTDSDSDATDADATSTFDGDGFTIELPPGWHQVQSGTRADTVSFEKVKDHQIKVQALVGTNQSGQDAGGLLDTVMKGINATDLGTKHSVQVDGEEGVQQSGEAVFQGVPLSVVILDVIHDERLFQISYFEEASDKRSDLQDDYDTVVDSFQFE
jgi:hypothetical protein